MSQIKYAIIIFPDHVYDEIELLQKELSYKDNKIWSVSNTIRILLRLCLEENDLINAQYTFLKEYMFERESFLEDFMSSVLMSMSSRNYDYLFD